MWRDTGALSFYAPTRGRGAGSIALRGFLSNILNPKLSIFFLAFLPQFVPAGAASPLLQMGWLSALFMAMTLVVFILYGFCAHGVRAYVVNSPKLIKRLQRSFALVFAALDCKLALADQ